MNTYYIVKVDYLKKDVDGVPRHKKSTYAVSALSVIEAVTNITREKAEELDGMQVESVNKAHKVVAYYEQDNAHDDAEIYKIKITTETTTANDKIVKLAEYLFILANDSSAAITTAINKLDTILETQFPNCTLTQIKEVI